MERRGEGRPDDWLFETLTRMEQTELRHASEQRSALADLARKMEEHAALDQQRMDDHSTRLTVVETERKNEKDMAGRQNGLQTLGIATGLMVIWEIAKRKLLGWTN